jgi:hypothetical protein
MKKIGILLLLLLAAPPAWSVVGCTIYTRSSDGDDADDGSTWALANATLAGSIADWTTSDIICIEDNHNETQATTMTLTPTGDTSAIPVPIYSVSDADDSYSIGSSCQVSVTGASSNISLAGNYSIAGVFFCSGNDILVSSSVTADWSFFRDVSVDLSALNSALTFGSQAARGLTRWVGGTIDFGGGGFMNVNRSSPMIFEGVTFTGDIVAAGLFRSTGANSGVTQWICRGCDLSAYTSETLVDVSQSNQGDLNVWLIGSELPATVSIHDDAFANPRQFVFVSGTDDSTSDYGFRQDLYTYQGNVETDIAVYHDNGLVFEEGSTNASFKFTPASHLSKHEFPLCSPPRVEWIATTGSKTFTTEGVENFTTALDEDEVWQEILYLGTSTNPLWSLDVGKVVGGTTSLTTGTGLANWTSEPSGSRSFKLETTVTINKAGVYQIRWCVAAYESGKVVHIDPKPLIQ